MKNIITILLILILPVIAYVIMDKNSKNNIATAQTNNLPTIIVFSSTMCIDCQKLKLVINELEEKYSNKVNFVRYNALDNNKKIKKYIKEHAITLVPTTIIFDEENNKIEKIEGYIGKEELEKKIEDALNE